MLIRLEIMWELVNKIVFPFLSLRFTTISISSKKNHHMFIILIFRGFTSTLRQVPKMCQDSTLGQVFTVSVLQKSVCTRDVILSNNNTKFIGMIYYWQNQRLQATKHAHRKRGREKGTRAIFSVSTAMELGSAMRFVTDLRHTYVYLSI